MGHIARSVRLSDLVNIGLQTEQLLHQARIYTQQELRELGPVEAWRRIKRLYPEKATLTCLLVLQGALLAIPWRHLPEEITLRLLAEVDVW